MISATGPSVLYVIGQLRRGGAEQQLYYLLREWPHDASVIVLECNPGDSYWVEPIRNLGYEVIELPRQGRLDVYRLSSLLREIRGRTPDILHIFTDSPSAIYGRLAGILARHNCVIVNERRHPANDPRWYRIAKRWLLNRYVEAMVANARSSLVYSTVHLGVSPKKAHYIPNGLDLHRFQRDTSINARTLLPQTWPDPLVVIGTVGSLLPKKDPEMLVRVARRVVDVHPEARFLHVGKGPLLSTVETLREELALKTFLHFEGERFDIPVLLQTMDIFVMTSRNEGMPNAAMEAMAMGLPCVVTDTGDSHEVVRDGETGYVVPIGDEEAIAERIIRLIKDPDMRHAMGDAGQNIIQSFGVEEMAARYRELYDTLIVKRKQ
jgi:glycosyltransferase involved in cell wall biosynthesis